MIEGMIELLIYSYFNYKSPNYNTIGEILGISQSYICLVLLLIKMPLINLYLLFLARKNINKLEDETI